MGTVSVSDKSTLAADLRILRTFEELEAVRGAWDALAAEDDVLGIFRGYDWNVLWLRHVAPDARPHVLTLTAGGELVGLASLCETVYADHGFRLPGLALTGRDVVSGDFLDILARPAWRERVLDAVFAHLDGELRRRSLLVLGEILDGSPTAARVGSWGRRTRRQEERRCPYIELPPSFAAYEKSLSRNMRSNLRRRTRQLLEEQGCTIVRAQGPDAVAARLPDLFRLHEQRWTEAGQTGTFVRPGFKAFLEAFVREAGPRVKSELYLLEHEGAAHAALLFFRWGRAAHFYQGGWDPQSPLARLSPGLALFGRSIADAIEDGCTSFEFLQGEESYKQRYTSRERRTATYLVAGAGLRVRAYLRMMQARDWLKRRLQERREHRRSAEAQNPEG